MSELLQLNITHSTPNSIKQLQKQTPKAKLPNKYFPDTTKTV